MRRILAYSRVARAEVPLAPLGPERILRAVISRFRTELAGAAP